MPIYHNFKLALIYCFWLLESSTTSCKHNTDMMSPFKVDMCWQKVACLHICQTGSNISIHLESCFWPPGECKPSIHPYLALFWFPPTPEGNICLLSCWMLHYVPQLVVNFIWLLFGAGQVVCGGFLEFFHWQQLSAWLMLSMWTKTVTIRAVKPKQWTERC